MKRTVKLSGTIVSEKPNLVQDMNGSSSEFFSPADVASVSLRLISLVCLLLWLSVPAVVSAQTTSSGVTGCVKSGENSLESVSVQLVSVEQGTTYGATTNRFGVYSISGIRPGVYDAMFSFVGYGPVIRSGIRLSVGENYVLDVEMVPKSVVLDDVEIDAEYSHFNETRTGQAYSIRKERLELLPSVNRSLLDYTRLSAYSGKDNSMAGRDGRVTPLNIDGAGLSNVFGLTSALPGGGSPVSVDAIDEVQIVIAPYDVRHGNFTGGGINAVTKSGSNTFKVTAYTYLRNEKFRGNKVAGYDLGERNTESKSVFGFTAGGPILHDVLFFFVNGEMENRPEPISKWRLSDNGIGDAAAMISRVTQKDMDRFANALSKYGYNAGTADLSDGGTTNYKLLARLDWNISDNHNLMLRYNYTVNSQWNTPNDFGTPVGVPASSARISQNSYAFRTNCYSLRDVAWSAVAELNSRIGRLTNRLLLTTSMVGNNRGSDSDLFPHIDIWKDGDMFMSAGYELFSLNTGNKTYSATFSDQLSWIAGHSRMLAGISYEFQHAATNYMMYGTGYYRYSSIEDFENSAAPVGYGYTYGYNGTDDSASKSSLGQSSLYFQSETRFNDRFRMTYGLRADITDYYEKLQTNISYRELDWTRHYFADGDIVPVGWNTPVIDTGRWPKISVMLSPRVGFNWDVTGEDNFVLHGGAGLFAGRIPLVFLTNMPNYSNLLQNTVMVSNDADGVLSGLAGNFLYTPESMRQYLSDKGYNMTSTPNAPVKSATLCGVSEDFKLPQVFKVSLAADWNIPVSFPASLSLEGIYNKDINAVYCRNLNLLNEGDFALFEGLGSRLNYRQFADGTECNSPLVYRNVTGGAMLLDNTDKGYSWSVAATLKLEPVKNLKIELSYIHQDSKSVSDMVGSSLYSTWKNTPSVNSSNQVELHTTSYVIPDRIMGAVTYSIEHGSRFSTSVGLFYNGCTAGTYSYTYSNDMNGDGALNDLLYIPASKDELMFTDNAGYTAAQQQEALWEFVCNDGYLSRHKGEFAGANDALMPWLNRFDIRVAETFRIRHGSSISSLQVSLDLMNAGNLLCSDWGVSRTPSACNNGKIMTYVRTDAASGRPVFTLYSDADGLLNGTFKPLRNSSDCWYLQLGIRYFFN